MALKALWKWLGNTHMHKHTHTYTSNKNPGIKILAHSQKFSSFALQILYPNVAHPMCSEIAMLCWDGLYLTSLARNPRMLLMIFPSSFPFVSADRSYEDKVTYTIVKPKIPPSQEEHLLFQQQLKKGNSSMDEIQKLKHWQINTSKPETTQQVNYS